METSFAVRRFFENLPTGIKYNGKIQSTKEICVFDIFKHYFMRCVIRIPYTVESLMSQHCIDGVNSSKNEAFDSKSHEFQISNEKLITNEAWSKRVSSYSTVFFFLRSTEQIEKLSLQYSGKFLVKLKVSNTVQIFAQTQSL